MSPSTCEFFDPEFAILRILTVFRGEGTGDGVVRSVLEAAIQKMTMDTRFWRCTLDEGYYTLAPRLDSTPQRRIQIKSFATLIMIAIFHGISPDPISPFLLSSILQGNHVLEDQQFIAAVAPLTARMFSDWPTDNSPVPATSTNLSLLANLNIEVFVENDVLCLKLLTPVLLVPGCLRL